MASTLPPVRGVTYNFPISLVSVGNKDIFQTNVTITTADVWVSKDGGAFVAATAAPVELLTGASAKTGVLWQNGTATEMTGDIIAWLYHDATGGEWQDLLVVIFTAAQTFDTTDTAVDTLATTVGTAGAGLTALGDTRLNNLNALALVRTTIATLASQVSFTITAGSADNSAYKDCVIVIEDASTAAQKAIGIVGAYVGGTKTVTLRADPGVFTMATTDIVTILPFTAAFLAGVVGTALPAESGAGRDAAALGKLLDVATPTGTVNAMPLATTQPAITWGQQKIAANVSGEGALDISNAHADGYGQYNHAGATGMVNLGGHTGMDNTGTANYGTVNGGGVAAMSPLPATVGDPMTLKTTQPAITWAQQKIVADVADQGALDIRNTDASGMGALVIGGQYGQYNYGSNGGQANIGLSIGQLNQADAGPGQVNSGSTYGVQATGGTAALAPMPAVAGDAMALTAGERTTLVAAVWAATVRTLTSLSAGVSDIAAAVWAYVTRTLTQSAAQVAAAVAGSDITIMRGDTVVISLTGLGNIADRTKFWLTVKAGRDDDDDESIIQIEETAGLLYLNRAAATTATDAALVVTDAVVGNVTMTLKPALTSVLANNPRLCYDAQKLTAAGAVTTVTEGTAKVATDVTRAIS